MFVVQWLFDEAQLTVDNIHLVGQPVQEGQWRYIQNLGIELRNTLKDVPWVKFAFKFEGILLINPKCMEDFGETLEINDCSVFDL